MSKKPKEQSLLSEEDKKFFIDALNNGFAQSYLEFVKDKIPEDYPLIKKYKAKKPIAIIDLHGKSVEQAINMVEYFIQTSIIKKQFSLKIIHGKGSGTLKSAIRQYLLNHSKVTSIKEAPQKLGGSGVILVQIKK
jgi:DNA mismatch repair protein MutS2